MTSPSAAAERARRRRRSARIDLVVVVTAVVGAFVVAARLDLFERFASWSRGQERYDADELAIAGAAAIVGLAAYSLRRYREARHETARLAAVERTIAETSERYRSLFDYHPHAVFSLSVEGRFEEANPASVRLAGYSAEELTKMSFPEVLVPEDLERATAAFLAVVDRQPQVMDLRVRHLAGRIIEVTVTAVPIVVGDEVIGVYGIAEDVTERNALQRDLEDARRAAESASEAKSVFLANMSHEIRTPLTSVLAASELLADSGLDDQQRRLTDMMHRSGGRLLRLVDEILDLSRVESGLVGLDRRDFDPRVVIEDVVATARKAAQVKGLDFEAAIDDGLPPSVYGDSVRVAQVLTNLLDNAVKFTDAGFVRISVLCEPSGVRGVVLQVAVADSGIGMSGDEMDRVFESFRQADPSITRKYGGTGLGLAIAKQLVELMDGSIGVASTPGEGTTFTVRLPLAVRPASSAAASGSLPGH